MEQQYSNIQENTGKFRRPTSGTFFYNMQKCRLGDRFRKKNILGYNSLIRRFFILKKS